MHRLPTGIFRATVAAVALAVLAVAGLAQAHAAATKVTLLLVCDTYEMTGGKERGGYARIAGVAARERAAGGNVVFVHAGDAFSPTLLSGFDKAEHVVDLLDALRLDVFVPGNHEYDFGPEVFRQRVAALKTPVLAANLREKSGEAVRNVADTRMLAFGEIRIGIVGATAQDSPVKSQPGDLVIADTVETVRAQAKALRAAGADIVVAVVHADRAIDRKLYDSRAADIILSGDDHDLWIEYNGRVAAAEAKQDGEYLVALDLTIDVTDKGGQRAVSWWPDFRILDTRDVPPDPAVSAKVAAYQETLSRELDVPLGTAGTELDTSSHAMRTGETAMGNLVADAVRAAGGADVALVNGGSLRGNRTYPPGTTITRRDVLTELPFGNKTVVIALTGDELRAALEHGLAALPDPGGRFPQVSGMTVVADPLKPPGQRVLDLRVAGEPVDPGRTYAVATNDFLMRGGDGYGFPRAKVLRGERDAKLIANDVMVFIRKEGTVAPRVEGRITLR